MQHGLLESRKPFESSLHMPKLDAKGIRSDLISARAREGSFDWLVWVVRQLDANFGEPGKELPPLGFNKCL